MVFIIILRQILGFYSLTRIKHYLIVSVFLTRKKLHHGFDAIGAASVSGGRVGSVVGVLFLVFLEEFFLNVTGHEFIGSELHGEGRAAAGD